MKEEKEDKQTRLAEMEIQKAQNLLEHEDEIKSRPSREWITSNQRKEEVAKAAKAAALGLPTEEEVKAEEEAQAEREAKAQKKGEEKKRKLSRKKRRRQEAAEMARKQEEEDEAEADEGDGGEKRKAEPSVKSMVKKAKREAQAKKKQYETTAIGDFPSGRQKPSLVGGMFDADMEDMRRQRRDGAGAGAGKKGKDGGASSRYNFSAFDPLKRLRKGGKPKKAAFKSKAKYKRKKK
ncbi:unnamed protein product [Chrysoparadoxa australica]